MPIEGVGSTSPARARGSIRLEFSSRLNPQPSYQVEALVMPKLTSYLPKNYPHVTKWIAQNHLALADHDLNSKQAIGIILGVDIYPRLIREGLRKMEDDTAVAQDTTLGWIITGRLPGVGAERTSRVLHCVRDGELLEAIQNFWRQEEPPNTSALTRDEEYCEKHFKETHQRLPDGSYCVRLPFQKEPQLLGDSTSQAIGMLKRMEAQFNRNTEFRELYTAFMQDYEHRQHMAILPPEQAPTYLLPHHGVLKGTSDTTKLRVVFNASVKSTSGYSLNDLLHTGPQLLPRLDTLLIRWRRHRICFSADIEKMFRGIRLDERDQQFQVIAWRNCAEEPIRYHKLKTVTYGMVCSPFLAIRTLRQLAEDEKKRFPMGSSIITTDVYMDDVLSGADTLKEAQSAQIELLRLLGAGKMKLRKWTANRSELLETLPMELRAKALEKSWRPAELAMLGLRWEADVDCFRLDVQPKNEHGEVTKRKVLKQLAQLFDPLGFAAPVTIRAKMFLQRLWLLGHDWDETLSDGEAKAWEEYCHQLPILNELQVPRWLNYSPQNINELHAFADASTRAYGAVLYLRTQDEETTTTTLMVAKTKVAPLKTVSLPRLELCAALLAARLAQSTLSSVWLWSDSTVTLSWLRGHPSQSEEGNGDRP